MDSKDRLLASAARTQWAFIGVRHHHGIDIPLFSLHSQTSCGIGEYTDLLPLIPWCRSLGMDVIQLLPLNDTGVDTSPYSAHSATALNPLHLGLSQLPYLDECPELCPQLEELRELNKLQRINYARVNIGRNRFLNDYYKKVGEKIQKNPEYHAFIEENPWVEKYALYKALKVANHHVKWQEWESELVSPTQEQVTYLIKKYRKEIEYHIVLQFLCFKQMVEVKAAADAHGVFLKGDLPILINRDSADVWLERRLFQMHYSAGSPPDMYSAVGQNWGFPIYDWRQIEYEHFLWWKQRLSFASHFYHIYRLDHVVGLFRIWSIPLGHESQAGAFIPSDFMAGLVQGSHILSSLLRATPMLPIGEDLGTVPAEVRQCLSILGICGTKVMRWERYWNESRQFIPYNQYPLESMTTVSTHDSETLEMWWRKNPCEAHDFARFKGWDYEPLLSRARHQEILRDSHHTNSLFHINLLQEYLFLVADMTWPDPNDERLNVPGLILETNWAYRFRPSVEEMINSDELKKAIQTTIR